MSLVLQVDILGEYKNLTAATKGAQSQLGALNKKMSSVSSTMRNSLAAIGLGFSITGIVNGLQDAVTAAEEVRKADQRLGNIAKSMNLFGKETDTVVKRLSDYASEQEKLTGVDGEVIKLTQAKLLTFGNLAKSANVLGGSFDRATKAAMDMAAAGFGTAEGNAVQLGKALNDPIKGINSLTKSGITFTEEEKKKIEVLVKSNKMLEAQDLVLKAIEIQVGGTAEATGTSSDKMRRAFESISEEIGAYLLPLLDQFSEWLNTPEGQEKLQIIIDQVKGIIDEFIAMAKWVIDNKDWLEPMVIAIGAVTAAWKIATGAVEAFKTAALIAGVFGAGATGVAAGVAAGAGVGGYQQGTTNYQTAQIYGQGFAKLGAKGLTQNITIKGSQSAQQIKTILQKSAKSTGTRLVDY